MAKHLNTHVHVHGPNGSVSFGPGATVPAWARKQITRDDVWDDFEPDEDDVPEAAQEPDTGDTEAESEFPPEPPRSGAGSGVEAWREFAAHPDVDLEVDDDASRDEIIAAWDAADAGE